MPLGKGQSSDEEVASFIKENIHSGFFSHPERLKHRMEELETLRSIRQNVSTHIHSNVEQSKRIGQKPTANPHGTWGRLGNAVMIHVGRLLFLALEAKTWRRSVTKTQD